MDFKIQRLVVALWVYNHNNEESYNVERAIWSFL